MTDPTMKKEKTRLDAYLANSGAFPSRARAQGAVKAGLVLVNGAPGAVAMKVGAGDDIVVLGDVHDYVSRGALKLVAGLDGFEIDPAGSICLDLGASTGGFTEVLLRRGAATVYAVDVGAGQLHQRVARDPLVVNLEKTHARDLGKTHVPAPIDLVVCDVSFISLQKALPTALDLCANSASLVTLIKPQFELGPKSIGKGGLVMANEEEIMGLIDDTKEFLKERGWDVIGVIDSPISGGDGNREYLIGARKTA